MTISNDISSLPAWVDKPVFIYGPRKGGTTLLQNLLDGSEHLVVVPSEVKIKAFLGSFFNSQPESYDLFYSKSKVLGNEFPGFDSESYRIFTKKVREENITNLRDMLRYDAYCIYKSIIRKPSKISIWGLKDVGGPTVEILKLFRHMFFNGKVVMIMRDPLTVTRSVLLDRRRKDIRLNWSQLLKQVKDPIRVYFQQIKFLDDPTIHVVAYENIAGGNIREEMKGICKYLNIPYSDIFERPTIFGNPVVVRTSSRDTKKVFMNQVKWHEDLTIREKIVILLIHKLVYQFLVLKGQTPISYSDVLLRLKNRNKSKLRA